MKKRILLFTSSIALLAGMIMSNNNGPATLGQNRTGSGGGPTTCSGVGCHAGGSYTNTVSITLFDSTGTTIQTSWLPNHTYKVILAGTSTAPKIGFQVSSAYFNGTTNLQAGTLSNLSAGTHLFALGGFNIVEHSAAISTVASAYTRNFDWKSPNVTTIDTVTFYTTVNGVNGTQDQNGDNSTHIEYKIGRNTTSVAELSADIKINAYPNPVTDKLNISLENAENGLYSISVFDMHGKVVATQTANVNRSFSTSVNASSWAAGMYHVQLKKGDAQRTIAVVKQ